MLARLRDWIAGHGEEDLAAIARHRDKVIFNLEKMQSEHCFIDVRFPERDARTFQSLILAVDDGDDLLTIDELYPTDDVGDVTAGEMLELTSRKKGIRMSFVTRIESIEHDGKSPLFKLQIPSSVNAKQQRKNYRVQLEPDSGVKFNVFDKTGLICTVVNVSVDGIGFYMGGNHTSDFKLGSILQDCLLKLPNGVSFHSSMEVRSCEFKKYPNRRTLIGGSFINLAPPDIKKLETVLATMQREQRKNESRED